MKGSVIAAVALVGVTAIAVPVVAQDHESDDFDPHPHMLLHGLEIETTEDSVIFQGFRRCVDLAASRPVPLHAHHQRLHFGDSGVSFGGASGHVVLPVAPFPAPFGDPFPWSNCTEFEQLLPLVLPNDED